MKKIEQALKLSTSPLQVLHHFNTDAKQRYCFFDIETTGLSANVSSLYLIGVIWYEESENTFCSRQWFADDYISEASLITSFHSFLSDFTTLVHYNGTGFDIPYIQKKCVQHGLPSPFESIETLDIYREIRPLKALFETPNLKLATIEKLVGFLRRDTLSGKDCIDAYSTYMQRKHFRDNQSMQREYEKLLCHNLDDLIGTYLACDLLSFQCPFSLSQVSECDQQAVFVFDASEAFPFATELDIACSPDDCYVIRFEEKKVTLTLPLYQGSLCHFFADYKNYYYLPAEDTAIHKSVGAYVEKEYREPAKASNCYVRKSGTFLPLPTGFSATDENTSTLFRSSHHHKQNYLPWDETTKQDSSLPGKILHALLFIKQ